MMMYMMSYSFESKLSQEEAIQKFRVRVFRTRAPKSRNS